jgi:two-component system nitrogen regulation sensor histidine kinase NtrY
MAVDASPSEEDPSSDVSRGPGTFRARLPAGSALGAGYALAAALIGVAVWMASSAPVTGPVGPPSRAILIVLGLNLVVIGGLAFAAGARVFRLVVAQRRDAGARLHLRFVAVFATAAVAPAIVVAIVFGVLVNQSVDSWFSHRVATVVENSATVAKSYVKSQENSISGNVSLMAGDLTDAAPGLKQNPIYFSKFLGIQASVRGFPAAYVLDRDGRVLARAEAEAPPEFLAPPPSAFAAADTGLIDAERFDSTDLIRALYKLKGFDDAYLYVTWPLEPGILAHLSETDSSLRAYRDTAANRDRIEAALELSYIETVLLVLVAAVWIGMAAASGISGPVARLIQAADRIAGGDLTARVNEGPGSQEMSDLARSFNRMTGDLQAQQTALRAAGEEAESRRQFIETVLLGVSAGVISVDGDGRILTANRQATALLGLPATAHGKPFDETVPEFAAVVAEAHEYGGDAEAEIDLVRDRETRRLRVRASGHADGGLVLTFDDITRLVTAQRNAAWKDVARRIAHEIKNPLTPIQLSAERLRRKYRKEITTDLETFDRCTETIIRQVGDVSRMVDEFSSFARMPAPKFERADAAELLRQAVFAQRVADPDVEIELAEPLDPAPVLCDQPMIGRALANVLKNAGEAIAARRAREAGLKGRIRARLVVDGDDLAFEIEDNGVGLPTKDRDRLTEPYVTTREKGTGLGLAIVKRIMEDHGGALVLLDAAERPGAKAVLHLPLMKTLEARAETDTEAA